MASPLASVIISAKNEAANAEKCLSALAAQKCKFPFELHFVDNDSSDNTRTLVNRWIRAEKRNNFFLWTEKKPGSPAARNLGAKKARGKVLLFTDADCVVDRHWVQRLATPLLQEHSFPLAATGGTTLSGFQIQDRPNLWERYLDGLFAFWEEDRLSAFPAFLPWAPTCNLAVQAKVFNALGGFDTSWKSGGYDTDFCWRLFLCGFVICHVPEAKLFHQRRHNLGDFLRQMENYAYFNQRLLSAYETELKLPRIRTRKERILSKTLRALQLIRSTQKTSDLALRALDGLSTLAFLKGNIRAQLTGPSQDPSLASTRRGITPPSLKGRIPRGYAFLHKEGWVYWKNPSDWKSKGDLILHKPQKKQWLRLNHSAWKTWEIKAERGQSEEAALVLGQSPRNSEVIRDIDELTLELRAQRLLP